MLLLLTLLFGCLPPSPQAPTPPPLPASPAPPPVAREPHPRAAALATALTDDNRVWADRTELVAHKLRRMAADPYNFMRGTAALYPLPAPPPGTGLPALAEATPVLIVTDPHPENFGCFLNGDPDTAASWSIEINDFDGATFGPWLHDVLRAAVGVRLIASRTPSCHATCQTATAEALAGGYAEEVRDRSGGEPGLHPSDVDSSVIAARLLRDCKKGHRKRKRLHKQASLEGGPPSLKRDASLNKRGRGVLDLTETEAAQVRRLTSQLAARLPDLVVHDAARLYGRGVSSIPALRYVLLTTPRDDSPLTLLLLREVVAPPALPYLTLPDAGDFATNAGRIEAAPRQLWSSPSRDPFAFGLTDGQISFKSQTWGSAFSSFDHDDILADLDKGKTHASDLPVFARYLGRLLAGHHARGVTLDGAPALPVLTRELGGGPHALAAFVAEHSGAQVEQLRQEAEWLRRAKGDLIALKQQYPPGAR